MGKYFVHKEQLTSPVTPADELYKVAVGEFADHVYLGDEFPLSSSLVRLGVIR
jgi:hypothetical protein